jgi:hypothetical protein
MVLSHLCAPRSSPSTHLIHLDSTDFISLGCRKQFLFAFMSIKKKKKKEEYEEIWEIEWRTKIGSISTKLILRNFPSSWSLRKFHQTSEEFFNFKLRARFSFSFPFELRKAQLVSEASLPFPLKRNPWSIINKTTNYSISMMGEKNGSAFACETFILFSAFWVIRRMWNEDGRRRNVDGQQWMLDDRKVNEFLHRLIQHHHHPPVRKEKKEKWKTRNENVDSKNFR